MTAVQPEPSPNAVETLLDKNMVPDPVIRLGIRRRCAKKLREIYGGSIEERHARERAFVDDLRGSEVAIHTDKANEQHYELPPEFFENVLGPRLKYSSGYWPRVDTTFAESERAMLDLYLERARMTDGQDILELGCGWGSLTLYMAEAMPSSHIVGVSNSAPQREFILARAREKGLTNVEIVTQDVNFLELERSFDRAISIEMFEHMKNYERLLGRVSGALKTGGLLFIHMFTHRQHSYHYELTGDNDWMARYFFTGGTMAADDLMLRFQNDLIVRDHWRIDGSHYERTSNAWLARMDSRRDQILPILAETYGEENVGKWWSRWRIFFMACAEMFGYDHGREWLVSHYLMQKRD